MLGTYYRERLDAKGQHYISAVSQGVVRMRELINDLLAYSRLGKVSEPTTPVDLNAVAQEVRQDVSDRLAQAGGTLTVENLPTVLGRRTELQQILQNLVTNAIKYRREVPPEVQITSERKGSEWIVHVQDNGIGIEPMYFEQIFKVFHRLHTRAQYPGSGIGLAICKKIVERNGGRIWVQSSPGKGSTFSFSLPAGRKE
ncbi:MAG: GHKL domain-containing protein [Elusimicrobia bacterium]|nr:GHKL domain-containing protein [Elusimicrobiota bacterium]